MTSLSVSQVQQFQELRAKQVNWEQERVSLTLEKDQKVYEAQTWKNRQEYLESTSLVKTQELNCIIDKAEANKTYYVKESKN